MEQPFIVAIIDPSEPIGSRMSHELAKSLQSPLIIERDIAQILRRLSLPTSSNELADDLAFEIISQLALTQLDLKFNVIINLLPFNDARLNKWVGVASSGRARLIIIQGENNNHHDDYGDDGCILNVNINEKSFDVNEVVTKIRSKLLPRPEEEDDDGVRKNAEGHNKLSKPPIDDHLHASILSEEPRTNDVQCKSCLKLVSGPSYECIECNEFTFHRLCGESSPNIDIRPPFLRETEPKQYDFRESHKCGNCEEFSNDCHDCLFQTNLKHGFLPAILPQSTHQHLLNFIIMPLKYNYQYKCSICDKRGSSVSYKCYECNYNVHVNCILRSLDGFSVDAASSFHQVALDKHNCHICRRKIEPNYQPFYWSEECGLAIHMKCMRLDLSIQVPIAMGSWGGQGGFWWDDGVFSSVKQLVITHGFFLESIHIEYDKNGTSIWAEKRGGYRPAEQETRVELDYPDEYLTSVHGYYGSYSVMGADKYVHSLTFESNKRTYGPFGNEEGTYFSAPVGKIVGFYGRSGYIIDAIGVYFKTVQ